MFRHFVKSGSAVTRVTLLLCLTFVSRWELGPHSPAPAVTLAGGSELKHRHAATFHPRREPRRPRAHVQRDSSEHCRPAASSNAKHYHGRAWSAPRRRTERPAADGTQMDTKHSNGLEDSGMGLGRLVFAPRVARLHERLGMRTKPIQSRRRWDGDQRLA